MLSVISFRERALSLFAAKLVVDFCRRVVFNVDDDDDRSKMNDFIEDIILSKGNMTRIGLRYVARPLGQYLLRLNL